MPKMDSKLSVSHPTINSYLQLRRLLAHFQPTLRSERRNYVEYYGSE